MLGLALTSLCCFSQLPISRARRSAHMIASVAMLCSFLATGNDIILLPLISFLVSFDIFSIL